MELSVAGYRCRLATGGRPWQPSNPAPPPLLLIHGAANDGDAWQQVAAGLAAAGCCVLAPDLPGHGLSGGP
ncbi:MAG TPA: alpha/beta fold hydrolase, partial [Accumulibacter sp.]|uniref:alpha/beta fold hydrolase n=1 Tax=Accumulibacter sp. TaxID=2053492 RepID=UPI002C50444C